MTFIYILLPSLLIAVVLAAVWLERWSVPVIIVALMTGILSGSDFIGLWAFDDIILTNQIANFALVFILFHGGLVTKRENFQAIALPASSLATFGVILTAFIVFVVLYWGLGWNLEMAALLSVIISSTDAAAIFSILRRQSLPPKLSSTVEIESAANDPMAILLTTVVVTTLTSGKAGGVELGLYFFWSFGMGPVIGFLGARMAIWTFNRLKTRDRGYYYVLFLGVVLLTYGIAEAVQASGMLAVFTAGLVLGNTSFVYRQGIQNFSEALSMIANIGMFVLMGLVVFPSAWIHLWDKGIILFAVLSFVARPIAVFLSTIGMRMGWRERTFTGWAGLRGAVPIVLATYPAAAGMPIAEEIFNLVFFAVLISILVQGSTLGVVARWLKLSQPARPKPLFNLEMVNLAPSDYDVMEVHLPGPYAAAGPLIRELNLPDGAIIVLITRDREIIAPKGNTRLMGWDHVCVLAHGPDEDRVREALCNPFKAIGPKGDP